MISVIVKQIYLDEFSKSPIFFLKKIGKEEWDSDKHEKVINYYWESTNPLVYCSFQEKCLSSSCNFILMAPNDVRELRRNNDGEQESISINVHVLKTDENDVTFLFNNLIYRSFDKDDRFLQMELLWFLEHFDIPKTTFCNVVKRYDSPKQKLIIDSIKKCTICLSYHKQLIIEQLLREIGIVHKVFFPDLFKEAYKIISPNINLETSNKNIFTIVDDIVNSKCTVQNTENLLIKLKNWLENPECPICDLDFLTRIYSLLSPNTRILIVKRLFHSVRMKQLEFDLPFFETLSNNKYIQFQFYRNSIYNPTEPIDISAPLLIDCITTYIKSNGKEFQTFNGILDRTIKYSDPQYFDTDLGLQNILPLCNGGVVYNDSNFGGFINYKYIAHISEDAYTVEGLMGLVVKFLNLIGKRENENEDKWIIKPWQKYEKVLEKVFGVEFYGFETKVEIHIQQINISTLRDRIVKYLTHNYESIDNHWLIIDKDEFINCFMSIDKIRIYCRTNIYLGEDIMNLAHKIRIEEKFPRLVSEEEIKRKVIEKEKQIVVSKVKSALENYLNIYFTNKDYVDIEYDEKKLISLLDKGFYSRRLANSEEDETFFIHSSIKDPRFCIPEYEDNVNEILKFPFYWCNRRQCYKNNLSSQSLSNVHSWQNYSLLHIMEIIGYPQLVQKKAGFQPKPEVRALVGLINKVKRFIKHLKCRECNHLMGISHPNKNMFNQYSYFNCINPNCKEYNKQVYLNYCYKCKKGLIDSRDNKKCPNGMHICPSCFGCCNDEVYEKRIQKYVASNKTVPDYLLFLRGKGHNDKNIFFCPKCGNQLIEKEIEDRNHNIKKTLVCDRCGHIPNSDSINEDFY